MYRTCSELGIFMYWTCNSMNNLLWVIWNKNKCFWKRFTCNCKCLSNIYIHKDICVKMYIQVCQFFSDVMHSFNFYATPIQKRRQWHGIFAPSLSAEVGPLNQKSILCEKYAHIVAVCTLGLLSNFKISFWKQNQR